MRQQGLERFVDTKDHQRARQVEGPPARDLEMIAVGARAALVWEVGAAADAVCDLHGAVTVPMRHGASYTVAT